MNSGKIDGSSVITGDEEKTQKQLADEKDENVQRLTWKDYASKAIKYSTSSFPLFQWKGIEFTLHGFVVAMIVIDLITNLICRRFYLWAPFALFRNVVLFSVVLLSCFIRIKFFGSKQLKSYDQQQNEQDEEKQEIETTTSGNEEAMEPNDDGDDIEFKSVVVSYLGGFVLLRKMSSKASKRLFYFGFPVAFHALLCILCLIFGFMSSGHGIKLVNNANPDARNLWFWLRNANLYCMVMCLLPVPGFDGAALLTIYLKKKNWNKIAITLSLVFISAIIIVVSGFIGFYLWDLIALYIAVFCGIKLLQFAFNPKDENMKVLRTMAKTTKQLSEADLI